MAGKLCHPADQNPPESKYTFCGTELDQVKSLSYQGFTVNSKLRWFHHFASIFKKCEKNPRVD